MRTFKNIRNEAGFTLIELMVTVAIFAIVLTAVYSAFTSQFNSYQTQEDVATVQADIRSAAEMLTRDIRNAGYGVPAGVAAIPVAGANSISLNLAGTNSSTYVTNSNFVQTGNSYVIAVASTAGFQAGQKYNIVDIKTKTVTMGNGAGSTDKITQVGPGNQITLTGTLANGIVNVGDLLVSPGVQSSGYVPVNYSLSGTTLTRTDSSNTPSTLSQNIKAFTLSYITDSNGNIVAVNFTIDGETTNKISQLSGQARTRRVNTIVALRNF